MSDCLGDEWWTELPCFETRASTVREDRLRLQRVYRLIAPEWAMQTDNFGKGGDVIQLMPPWLKLRDLGPLITLDAVIRGRKAAYPLASALAMRRVRQRVIGAMLTAFKAYSDDDLRMAVVLKKSWVITPERLMTISAAALKNQFFSDLKRTGIASIPGPLIAFIEGEFEPTSGMFCLHINVLTTPEKAAALQRLKKIGPYEPKHFRAPPIRVDPIVDRVRQVSYLLKSFWVERAVRDGKRDRKARRISEPYHTTYLAWLANQKLDDMVVMNGVWSAKKGGSATMRSLYLSVKGS